MRKGGGIWRDIKTVDDFIGRWEGIHYFYSEDKNKPMMILRAVLEYKKHSDKITFILTTDDDRALIDLQNDGLG